MTIAPESSRRYPRAGVTANRLDKPNTITALTPTDNHCPLFRCLTDGVHSR
jgi:hypothetical protein